MQKNRQSEELAAAKKRFAAAMEEISPKEVIRAAPLKSAGVALLAGALAAFASGTMRALPLPLRDIYLLCSRFSRWVDKP